MAARDSHGSHGEHEVQIVMTWPARMTAFVLCMTIGFAIASGIAASSGYSLSPLWAAIESDDLSASFIKKEVAYALSALLIASAAGIAIAYAVTSVIIPLVAIRSVKRKIENTGTPVRFSEQVDVLTRKIGEDPFIGHEWVQYSRSLRRSAHANERDILHATSRPSAYINLPSLRDNVPSLKMMTAIPGYFVGLGLLMTFVGLVLALSKAGQAVAGSDAQAMQVATRELLQAATFKFATSIAGLFASIVLSILGRLATQSLESALHDLNKSIEDKVQFDSAANLTATLRDFADEQLTQLKELNSAAFAQRLGEQMGVPLGNIGDQLQAAAATSAEMAKSLSVLSSPEFAASLGSTMAPHLEKAIKTGMDDVARAVDDASQRSSGDTSARTDALLEKLTKTFTERTDGEMQAVATTLEATRKSLAEMINRISQTGSAFEGAMRATAETLRDHARSAAEEGARQSIEGTKGALDSMTAAADHMVDSLGSAISKLEAALSRAAFESEAHASAISQAAKGSLDTADAFQSTAAIMRESANPIAGATDRLAATLSTTVSTLDQVRASITQEADAATTLAATLAEHNVALAETWEKYGRHLANLDQSLSESIQKIATAFQDQRQSVTSHVKEIDKGFADAIDRLGGAIREMGDASEAIADQIEAFGKKVTSP